MTTGNLTDTQSSSRAPYFRGRGGKYTNLARNRTATSAYRSNVDNSMQWRAEESTAGRPKVITFTPQRPSTRQNDFAPTTRSSTTKDPPRIRAHQEGFRQSPPAPSAQTQQATESFTFDDHIAETGSNPTRQTQAPSRTAPASTANAQLRPPPSSSFEAIRGECSRRISLLPHSSQAGTDPSGAVESVRSSLQKLGWDLASLSPNDPYSPEALSRSNLALKGQASWLGKNVSKLRASLAKLSEDYVHESEARASLTSENLGLEARIRYWQDQYHQMVKKEVSEQLQSAQDGNGIWERRTVGPDTDDDDASVMSDDSSEYSGR